MPFQDILKKALSFDINAYFEKLTDSDIEKSLNKQNLNENDFLNLLSDKAFPYLETMAKKARELTIQRFGRVIQLYIPLYISNYCNSGCVYCGFSRQNIIPRKKLSLEEIERNAVEIAKSGMKHILILTGEDSKKTPMPYLLDAIKILKKYFSSISVEMFPMEIEEYRLLKEAGVDGLTIYQEVYDSLVYKKVHLSGRKMDYYYRLNAPDRGAQAGFRSVNIGPLFGLGEPLKEGFITGLHAKYLQDTHLNTEISVSLPRINTAEGGFRANYRLNDTKMVQLILAVRLFLPSLGIVVSTRETAAFRDNLIGLGVTRMSAGSDTSVGGYIEKKLSLQSDRSTPQFEICDNRSARDIASAIESRGFQAVFKDWDVLD